MCDKFCFRVVIVKNGVRGTTITMMKVMDLRVKRLRAQVTTKVMDMKMIMYVQVIVATIQHPMLPVLLCLHFIIILIFFFSTTLTQKKPTQKIQTINPVTNGENADCKITGVEQGGENEDVEITLVEDGDNVCNINIYILF